MAIEEVIIGGAIGLLSGLVVSLSLFMLQRHYQSRDEEREMANHLKNLLLEIKENKSIIEDAEKKPYDRLHDESYHYLRTTGKLAGKTGDFELTVDFGVVLENCYRKIGYVNKIIDSPRIGIEFPTSTDPDIKIIIAEKKKLLPLLDSLDRVLQTLCTSYSRVKKGEDMYGTKYN